MNDSVETPTVKPATETRRSAALKKFALTFGILCVLWLVLVYILPYIARVGGIPTNFHEAPNGEPVSAQEIIEQKNQQISELNGRIDQLDAKLKGFEDVLTNMPKTAPADADAKIAAMQAKLDSMLQSPVSTEQNERVTQLEDKMGEQQKTLSAMKNELGSAQSNGMHEVAVITVFGQIKDAVARGDGFADLLTQLKALTPEDKPAQDLLSQLTPFADKGIITLPVLQNAFEVTVPIALSPDANNGSVLGNLRSLIRVRKVGSQQLGGDDESVIARAESRINRGDVDGCVKELAQLSTPAATAFAAWNNQAQMYVQLHEVLNTLQLALITGNPVTPVVPESTLMSMPAPSPAMNKPRAPRIVTPDTELPDDPNTPETAAPAAGNGQ